MTTHDTLPSGFFDYLDRRFSIYNNIHGEVRNLAYGSLCTSGNTDMKAINPYTARTTALFEFKFPHMKNIDFNTFQFNNMCSDAEALNVPAFLVRPILLKKDGALLDADEKQNLIVHAQFQVAPINQLAIQSLGARKVFSWRETTYFTFAYKIRGLDAPTPSNKIFDKIYAYEKPSIIWRYDTHE